MHTYGLASVLTSRPLVARAEEPWWSCAGRGGRGATLAELTVLVLSSTAVAKPSIRVGVRQETWDTAEDKGGGLATSYSIPTRLFFRTERSVPN